MEQNGDVMGVMNMEAAEDAPSWIRVRVLRSRAPSCRIYTLPVHRLVEYTGTTVLVVTLHVYRGKSSEALGTVSKGATVYIKYIANVYFYFYF